MAQHMINIQTARLQCKEQTDIQNMQSNRSGEHFQTRNSSGDEIANVNFLYDDIVHALQNTIDSCINSAAQIDAAGTQVYEIQ